VQKGTTLINLESYFRYSSAQSWVIGASLYCPLWDAGERAALRTLAEARLSAVRTNLEIRKRQLDQKLEQTFARLILEHERLEALQTRITDSRTKKSAEDDRPAAWEENALETQGEIELLSLYLKRTICEASFHASCLEFLKATNSLKRLLTSEKAKTFGLEQNLGDIGEAMNEE
jgi:hypothetical protein